MGSRYLAKVIRGPEPEVAVYGLATGAVMDTIGLDVVDAADVDRTLRLYGWTRTGAWTAVADGAVAEVSKED